MRDSSAIRTKSFRIPSRVRFSISSVPFRPPASPHATTGSPSRFSARATLMPLPPARDSPRWQRCRWPSWKFATLRVLSIAAFGVTVTITVPEGSGRTRAGRVGSGRGLLRNRTGRDTWPANQPSRSNSPGAATARVATSGGRGHAGPDQHVHLADRIALRQRQVHGRDAVAQPQPLARAQRHLQRPPDLGGDAAAVGQRHGSPGGARSRRRDGV